MTRVLDGGEGRGAEKVRAVRDNNGLGALHLAAARGKLPVCRYLVVYLSLDVNSISEAGGFLSLFLCQVGFFHILEWSDLIS